MQNRKYFFLGCMTILLLNACNKTNTDSLAEIAINDNETVVAGVQGIVVNENNVPVPGAAVKCGTASATTDSYGMFSFKGISIAKNNGYVKVSKTGYFNGNRTFVTTAGRTHLMRIKLLPKTNTGSFVASAGGVVTLSTGSKVTFVSNSITDAGGTAYTGTVNVAMAWINPTAPDLGSIMQGDLRGVTVNGYERVLETYGMLGVELTGASGQELKIAPGKKAELSVTIPAALQATAPASIPLWHFDETKGRWIEEGTATKTGNNYVGSVAHFSFWNCDYGAAGINLCINLVNTNSQPLNNVTVRLRRANNLANSSYGQTDSLGNVCGNVFANEILILDVLNQCGTSIYSQNIGPFSVNTSINIVATIAAANIVTFSGTLVNCNNAPVTNGSLFIYQSGGYGYNFPVLNGTFSVSLLNCTGTTVSYNLTGIDNSTLQNGNTITISSSGGSVNVGPVTACGNILNQFINMTIDGVPYTWTMPGDSIYAYDQGPFYGYTNAPVINSIKTAPGMNSGMSLILLHNAAIGTYPISSSSLSVSFSNPANSFSSQQITTVNPTVNLTLIGTPGTGYLEGNYNINMLFQPGNIIRNVVCSFKVRRP